MSMGIPSCLLQLEKTAINSWDGSGRISMQQFRLCHCVLYTHYHSFVTLGAVSCPDRGNTTLPLCNGFNLTRLNTNLTVTVSYLSNCKSSLTSYVSYLSKSCYSGYTRFCFPQFDKLIQYNVNGNISKLAASVSFSSFRCFVSLALLNL